jgi:hypothetical protein
MRRRKLPPASEQYIVHAVSEQDVLQFLKTYPEARKYVQSFCYGINILQEYRRFLMWFDSVGRGMLGGKPETVTSKHFGTKTFWKYDFPNGIGWANVFQYLWKSNLRKGR